MRSTLTLQCRSLIENYVNDRKAKEETDSHFNRVNFLIFLCSEIEWESSKFNRVMKEKQNHLVVSGKLLGTFLLKHNNYYC